MKKVLLSVVTIMVALAAGAQNKAIDELAAKYADREGFTVVNMEGEMIRNMGGMMGGMAGNVDATKLLEGLSAMTIIVSENANAEFAEEMRLALAAVEYVPFVSHADGEAQVKIATIDLKGKGKRKNEKEMVIMVIENNTNVLIRLIGDLDPAVLAGMAGNINK